MDLQLTGKLALVTGSTAGIGLAIAKALAGEGGRVVVNGRTEARVDAARGEISAACPEARLESLAADLATAAGVFSVPLDKVTPEQRRAAKTVNFSIIYGAGASNLSNQLGIKRTEAKELIENYFRQYSGLRDYMTNIVESARKNGYVETLLGRRRYLRDINSGNGMMRSMSERIAINTPIQGTAADLIKVAMVNIWKAMREGNFKSHMILQVHDELVFDARKDELERLKPIIKEKMQTAIPNLKVPILVEMGTGENWLEAH